MIHHGVFRHWSRSWARCSAELVGQVEKLGSAREPISDNDCAGWRVTHGRQQLQLGHRHRDLVVPLLDAEVAGQAAAARQPLDRRARRLEQRHVGVEAQDRRLVAVRLHDERRTGQVRSLPAVGTPQELGEREDALRHVDRPRVVEQLDGI